MSKPQSKIRPPFPEALKEWKEFLKQHNLPHELIWVFDENLCFEKDPAASGGFKLGFQTAFTPPPHEAERLAYEHFLDFEAPIVFYRIGSYRNQSVCVVMSDAWFNHKSEDAGYHWPRPNWALGFRPGDAVSVEEIHDENRWRNRIVRDRPLHDLDFCLDLRGVHEVLAHGRVLTTYEHYALKLLHLWRQIFEKTHHQ